MRLLIISLAAAAALTLSQHTARAELLITVDKSSQRVSVSVNGWTRYTWPTSTARRGYSTPSGTYRPQRLERKWFSRRYHNSPMPYSIFFHHGFAIHGSYEYAHLGQPASHGCVRLHPQNAATLFAMVKDHGMKNTRIVVTGSRPSVRAQRSRNGRGHSLASRRNDDRGEFTLFGLFND